MKKGFTLVETLVSITLFSVIAVGCILMLKYIRGKNGIFENNYEEFRGINAVIDSVNNNFDYHMVVDYEESDNHLFFNRERYMLLFFPEKTVINGVEYQVKLADYEKYDDHMLLTLRTNNKEYLIKIKGIFHEIHSD